MPLFKFNLCRSTGGAGGAQKPDVSFLEGTSFSRRYEVPVLECVKKKMKLFWQFVKRETRRRCVELRVLAVVCARAFTATYPLPPPFILARSSTGGSLLAHIHAYTRARSLQAKKEKKKSGHCRLSTWRRHCRFIKRAPHTSHGREPTSALSPVV